MTLLRAFLAGFMQGFRRGSNTSAFQRSTLGKELRVVHPSSIDAGEKLALDGHIKVGSMGMELWSGPKFRPSSGALKLLARYGFVTRELGGDLTVQEAVAQFRERYPEVKLGRDL